MNIKIKPRSQQLNSKQIKQKKSYPNEICDCIEARPTISPCLAINSREIEQDTQPGLFFSPVPQYQRHQPPHLRHHHNYFIIPKLTKNPQMSEP